MDQKSFGNLVVVTTLPEGFSDPLILVVTDNLRGRGIGPRLLAQAEQWAANNSIGKMLVRSRTSREAAHRFYEREGYSFVKTSAVFEKALS